MSEALLYSGSAIIMIWGIAHLIPTQAIVKGFGAISEDNKKILAAVFAGSVAIFVVAFLFIRQQTAIGDEQFLRSMIPHHASALLMCEEADIQDPRILELCEQIRESQQREIDLMTQLLEELK